MMRELYSLRIYCLRRALPYRRRPLLISRAFEVKLSPVCLAAYDTPPHARASGTGSARWACLVPADTEESKARFGPGFGHGSRVRRVQVRSGREGKQAMRQTVPFTRADEGEKGKSGGMSGMVTRPAVLSPDKHGGRKRRRGARR